MDYLLDDEDDFYSYNNYKINYNKKINKKNENLPKKNC